jgi:hypothetical protein
MKFLKEMYLCILKLSDFSIKISHLTEMLINLCALFWLKCNVFWGLGFLMQF